MLSAAGTRSLQRVERSSQREPAYGPTATAYIPCKNDIENVAVAIFFSRLEEEMIYKLKKHANGWLKGSFSCKWVKKSIFFFHHYSIAYAFRNTHVKFQAGIRKIVEVMNFFVTSYSTSGFWRADFKRVFLETMFFKLTCTITEEQRDIFQ